MSTHLNYELKLLSINFWIQVFKLYRQISKSCIKNLKRKFSRLKKNFAHSKNDNYCSIPADVRNSWSEVEFPVRFSTKKIKKATTQFRSIDCKEPRDSSLKDTRKTKNIRWESADFHVGIKNCHNLLKFQKYELQKLQKVITEWD